MDRSEYARKRTKTEMQRLDDLIRPLYENGLGCRKIGDQLGEDPSVIYKRVRSMGLVRSVLQAHDPAPSVLLPFTGDEEDHHLRTASIGEAVAWFLRRGYVASVPMSVTHYDLVVESDDGFKRVQVKSTTSKDRYGRWSAHVSRMEYGTNAVVNTNGNRKRRPYLAEEIDLFFIITSESDKYLIPLEATGGASTITLDRKYLSYRV